METTGSGRGFGAAQVYQLRLPLMANERLKELAEQQGTSPDALARDWVMQHLADADAPVPEWPEDDAREPAHARPQPGQQYDPAPPYTGGAHPEPQYAQGQYPEPQYPEPHYPQPQYPEAQHPEPRYPEARYQPPRHAGAQQYAGQLYPQHDAQYADDPYHVEETDTEITIPGGQYRY